MRLRNPRIFIPSAISVICFVSLLLIALLTNPVKNVSYALFFFALTGVLVLSLGHLLVALRKGQVTPKARSKIVIISALIVFSLMFRSGGSLNWVDLLVMGLLGFGLLFYTGRRQ